MTLSGLCRFVFIVAAFAGAAGCSLELGPVPPRLTATYAATLVGDKPLPVTSDEGGGHRRVLIADTLSFGVDGSVKRITLLRMITPSPNAQDTVYRIENRQPYTVKGTQLTLLPNPCPPNANCVGPIQGEINSARLTLPSSFIEADGGRVKFERVSGN